MEILKAREMGFCFGVRRAINIMERAAQERGPIESLGAIVHNRQVVDMLAQRGITVIDELEDSSCNIVAITSHGVGPEVPETARNMGLTVIDTTCPFVRKAQAAGKKLVGEGFRVVIFGEADHPEVKGVLGWTGDAGIATTDWTTILSRGRLPRRLGIISQTTQSTAAFGSFVKELVDTHLGRLVELRVINTICNATTGRQSAALELAHQVDLMIVIGGRNSANTRHLAQLCAEAGAETYHVETAAEIEEAWFESRKNVGITAGASTPAQSIDEVILRVEELTRWQS